MHLWKQLSVLAILPACIDNPPHIEVVSSNLERGIVYQEGAENGLNGYTATGLWHVTRRRAKVGRQSFWYGQESTGNYDIGARTAGTLSSPRIDLTATEDPELSFAQFVDVENGANFDRLSVTVTNLDNLSDTVTFSKAFSTTNGQFLTRQIPLGSFAGRPIRLQFGFDSIDPVFNTQEGWFIDEIRISDRAVACSHDVCELGGPLASGCSSCAQSVCAHLPSCCSNSWSQSCVDNARVLCGARCTCSSE